MKISATTFTIVFSTFSASLATSNGFKHEGKLGMRRHIVTMKRSAAIPYNEAPQDSKTKPPQVKAEQAAPSNPVDDGATHQNEKRAFYGKGTYFNPGEGACGWYANSHDHIAALNKDQYGDMSRKSPRCGTWIRITNRQTGASTKAQVQDACPGCGYGDLDMSPAAFDDLGPQSQGVVQIEWDYV